MDFLFVYGMSYFINVRVVDMVGYSSNIFRFEVIIVDKIMLEGLLCKMFLEYLNVMIKILIN